VPRASWRRSTGGRRAIDVGGFGKERAHARAPPCGRRGARLAEHRLFLRGALERVGHFGGDGAGLGERVAKPLGLLAGHDEIDPLPGH